MYLCLCCILVSCFLYYHVKLYCSFRFYSGKVEVVLQLMLQTATIIVKEVNIWGPESRH
jgi:hypothetical protein